MWNKSILLLLTISGLIAQDERSFNFQTNGANEDFVTIPHNAEDPQIRPTAGMTLEAWVKPTEDPASYDMNGIVSYFTLAGPTVESGFAFMYKEGKWRFVVITANDEDVFPQLANWPGTEIPYDGNTWTHIAGTYDGATARIFKNGVEQDSYSAANVGGSIVWEDIATDLYIGKYLDGNTSFKGSIDEVRIWDIARLENEIQASMNSTVDVNESGLTGYWKFDENILTTIVDYAEGTPAPGQNPGFLTNGGNGTWDTDVFAESGGDCFDMEITEADFPFSHLADLTTEDDDWDQSTFPFSGGGEHSNGANGADYTYKLTLSQPATIYVTTCDALTNVDIQIGIYTDDCSEASWIFFQDDSNSPIYYPDQTTEQYEFDCISGFESAPQYANMLPRIVWDAGTYYIVVDDRAGTPGTGSVKTWMGYSLLVDSTEVAGDFSGVDYFFSEGVYGGEYAEVYNGNGIGLETSDYNLEVNPNGGDANQVNLTSLEASNGASLNGGEEIVVLNLEYPITPSGGEILTVGPASVSSIFNSVGVPLLDIDGITINLVDEVAPKIEFTNPVNGQTGVPSGDNITIRFSEKIRNSLDESNITNSNATECFKLEKAISDSNLTFTIISPDQIEFIINPDGQLPENTEIKLSILATIEDQNNNGFQFDTLRFLTADETAPQIQASSISSINDYVAISFNENVYSSAGFSNAPDLTYMGEFGGHKYYGSNYQLTWTDASDYLAGFDDAHLVTISSQEENDFISGGWASGWIGFNDIEEEDNWVWVTGEDVVFTNWNVGEPNNAGEEHYAEIFFDGTWNDLPNQMHTFIAEVEGGGGSIGGLEISDFTYTFNANGGNCESIILTGFSNNLGDPLSGGETTIHALISLSGAPSGVETITFSPVDTSIFDFAGNSMDSDEISSVVTLLASALLISTDLADSNIFIDLGFSVGIYGNAYQSLPAYLAGFESSIESNGGTATTVTMTSLTDLEDTALVGGEDSVRIHMSFNELPSGVETITVSPTTDFSVYSISGVPIPTGETYGPISLFDEKPPVGSDDIENGDSNVFELDTITISFNENIYFPSTGNQVTIGDLAPLITLKYDNNLGVDIPFLLEYVNNPSVISFYPAVSYESESTIYFRFASSFQDENENPDNYDFNATFTVRDYLPPEIDSSVISPVNSYVSILFNEGVYANDNSSGALDISDLDYVYSVNGGNCDFASVISLTKVNGSALEGGEATIRAQLELSGSASGVETLVFSPVNSLSIFDEFGNAMLSSVQTDPVNLLPSAYIEAHSLADSNEFVDLYFSVGVYGNSIQTQPLYLSALSITISPNGGSATEVTPTNLTDLENNVLLGGEDSIRLFMDFNNLPSGQEKIYISPTTPYSIYSYSGIPVPTSEGSDLIQLIDELPPMGDDSIDDGATEVDQGDSLTLTFSEDLYIPQTGEIATELDLAEFITLKLNDSLGADIPFILIMDGSPPTITIKPVETYSSEAVIHYAFNALLADVNGNEIEINFGASFTIQDYLAPAVDSSALAIDNSYLDIMFDEEIYGTDQESGAIGNNTIQLELFNNGSVTDTVIITSLTRTDSNFLIGGETNIRLNLEYNSTPSGDETIVVTVENGVEIYDGPGNQMSGQAITDTIPLYDILPPSVDTISVPIDSFIVLMENTPITYSFNEKVDSLDFTVTATVADSINFDSTRTDSAIEIILQPPFTSFDSITVYFSYIQDEAGLSTVDIAYTYVTPLLGDYNLDSTLSFIDLDTLVNKWKDKDFNFELGPVTGDAPHFVSSPDSKFDIEDGMAFVRMWSWYQKTYGEIIQDTLIVGRPLEMLQNDNNLLIILDKQVHAGQIQFSYDIGESPIQFGHRQNKNGELFINNQNPEKGYSILEFARTGEIVKDTISIKIKNEIQDITIFYKLVDGNKAVVHKGVMDMNSPTLPTQMALYPAYPNPFNPIATIRFDIPEVETQIIASLHIYDIRGRLVETLVNGSLLPGTYAVQWQADGFSSGMYFVRLRYGKEMRTQKILLLK